jgi:hypothetical protein
MVPGSRLLFSQPSTGMALRQIGFTDRMCQDTRRIFAFPHTDPDGTYVVPWDQMGRADRRLAYAAGEEPTVRRKAVLNAATDL